MGKHKPYVKAMAFGLKTELSPEEARAVRLAFEEVAVRIETLDASPVYKCAYKNAAFILRSCKPD